MFDLQVLALQADMTRIVTFQLAREGSTRTYPQIGVPEPHHPVSHHTNDPEKLAKLAKINAYHVSLFAYLLERLQATPDGDGTLLDHSTYVLGSGMGNPDIHDHRNLPIVVARGGIGGVKGGYHLRYPDETPLANLHLTLLDGVGVHLDNFVDSTGRAGVISEPLVAVTRDRSAVSVSTRCALVAGDRSAGRRTTWPQRRPAHRRREAWRRCGAYGSSSQRGADVNALEADGTTALHWAAYRNDVEIADALVRAGAQRGRGQPLRRAAARPGRDQRPRRDRPLPPRGGRRSEHAAVGRRNRADDWRPGRGAPGPSRRCWRAGQRSTRARAWRAQTALMWAAAEGHDDVIRALVAKGADLAARSKNGFTPLLFAAREGHREPSPPCSIWDLDSTSRSR